ncbi:MAG: histidine phosphatase family protein [Deferrisomatales bacterium]
MPHPAPTRLFLVRHGEVFGEGVLHGHVDVALTPRGRQQMEAVAQRLAGEDLAAVYCSDLSRAREGARAVASPRGLPVREDPAFRELHLGRWDDRSFAVLWREERELLERWRADLEGFVVPGGESLSQLRARVLPSLEAALGRHPGRSLCLVAHGGVNRVILFEALGVPLARFHSVAQEYACLNQIDYHPDGRSIVRLVNG